MNNEFPGFEAIPTLSNAIAPETRRVLEPMRRLLGLFSGADGKGRAITLNDLKELTKGVLTGEYIDIPVDGSLGGQLDVTPPPNPTGLQAMGALARILLTWDAPPATFRNYAYTEIWRSNTNDIGTAVKVGTSVPPVAADDLGTRNGGGERFYWIRFVSTAGVAGGFNAQAGTMGKTGVDASYLLEVLAANPPQGVNYNPLLWVNADPNLVINGVPVPTGTYMQHAYIANGSIGRLQVGIAAIDDARIANLSAVKITAGDIDANRMKANIVQAVQGQFVSLSAVSANLGTVQINEFGYLRSNGVASYGAGIGLWMGWENGYKFRIGNPNGHGLFWDGTTLTIRGDVTSTGNGSFSGTFRAGGITGVAGGPAGSSGMYVGPDGLFGGYANGYQDVVGGALLRLDIPNNLIQIAANDVLLDSNAWQIYPDGFARFRKIEVYGDDGATVFPKSVGGLRTQNAGSTGASSVSVTLPGPAFVTVMGIIESGEGFNWNVGFGPSPRDYVQNNAMPTYSGAVRAGITSSGTYDVPTMWVPAGTYYLTIGVDTTFGGAAGNNTCRGYAMINPA